MESLVTQATQSESPAQEQQAQSDAQQESQSWYWGEGVAGNGPTPDWYMGDKYKSVAEQARGYKELLNQYNSKIKGFTGAPEGGYQIPEGVSEDSPLLNILNQVGQKHNMNQDMYDELISNVVETLSSAENERLQQSEARIKEEIGKLGQDANIRLKNIADYASANFDQEGADELINMATNAKAVEIIEQLINGSKPTKPADTNKTAKVEGDPYEKLREMQFAKNDKGQRLLEVDMDYRRKYESYARSLEG